MITRKQPASAPSLPWVVSFHPSRLLFLVVLLTTILLGSAPPFPAGQKAKSAKEKPYALLFGTVWGPDSRPMYGIHVKIRRASERGNKARWNLYSDHNGEFAQRVPAGREDYILWADVKEYKLQNGKKLQPGHEVTVHVENDERVDTGLHLTE